MTPRHAQTAPPTPTSMAPEIKHHCNDLRVVQNLSWFRSRSRCKQSNEMFQLILVSIGWRKKQFGPFLLGLPRQFLAQIRFDFEVFKTHLPSLIAGLLKEFVAGGVRHVRALRGETAVKGQGLSGVIG